MSTSTAVYSPSVAVPTIPRVSWTIWAGVLAVTSSLIGGAWDVSWHRSIGRDAFLTTPHLFIYACGVIAAVVCGYLIFATTFSRARAMRDISVQVLGFHAPLGAFIAAWGGIAMLTSAPFDNWWHNAYGLDVKIISPPHTLLILGIRGVSLGMMFLTLAAMNRAAEAGDGSLSILRTLYLYLGGLTVAGQMFFLLEYTWDVLLHTTAAYIAMAIALPPVFAILALTARTRWACTIAASIYTALGIAEILIFPLVPASPKLGPVYNPITHLVPMKFPILILLPALALDLLFHYARPRWKTWQIALAAAVVFVVVLFAVEWPFASFLMTKASENRFFGTIYFDYNSRADGWDRMREFFNPASGLHLVRGLTLATACAFVTTWLGLVVGKWMRGVQR